jgi:Rad3-related DNA helicase
MSLLPKDLGLPEKFVEWRPGQVEIAAKIASSPKYAYLLDAPTGSGKSLIAAAVQRVKGVNTTYVATTKQLQDQLLHDFPYAKTLKGRANYRCLKYYRAFPEISAEDCSHTEDRKCELRHKCPYMVAKRQALDSPLAVLNTAYFLTEINYVGAFSGRDFLVIDEFDTLEDQLMSFIKVVITSRQLSSLHVNPPKFKTKFESWVEWARDTLSELRPRLRELESQTDVDDSWATIDVKLLRDVRNLKRLVAKLEFFGREVDKTWIWYPQETMWTFQPVWVAKYSNASLWKHTKKVLGMSATILDPRQVSSNVGLTHEGRLYEYKALPSLFPKENRPVYYEPCANVVNKSINFALPRLTKAIVGILDKHKNDKILIHTVSYKIRDHIMKSVGGDRLVTHSTVNRADILDMFKKSPKPLVLVSPSMERGVDLPQDECRVVVIAKMPYPDLGDIQVSKRIYSSVDGNNWYAHKTISTVVQMSGRAVRSADDYAATYILDEQFGRLYSEHKNMFPQWFKEAVIL